MYQFKVGVCMCVCVCVGGVIGVCVCGGGALKNSSEMVGGS